VLEETFKHLHAKTSPGFGEHTMVRNSFIQVVTEKPSVGHIHLDLSHQTAFRSDAVQIADKKGFEEDNRVHGWLAGVAVVRPGKGIDEGEIDGLRDFSEEMIFRDETVKRKFVVELRSKPVFPHHRLLPPWWG
jgi:hypothetical protein